MSNNIDNARLPKELDCSNISVEWPIWKRNFTMYMIASGKFSEPEPTKIATFIWLIGAQGANIYGKIFPNDGSTDSLLGTTRGKKSISDTNHPKTPAKTRSVVIAQRTLDEVLKKFDDYCDLQKNLVLESFNFNKIVQNKNQSFSEFEKELRAQLCRCEFKCICGVSYEDRILRDRIVRGLFDKDLQLKLLELRDGSLMNVIEMCRISEAINANKIEKKEKIQAMDVDVESGNGKSSFNNGKKDNNKNRYNDNSRNRNKPNAYNMGDIRLINKPIDFNNIDSSFSRNNRKNCNANAFNMNNNWNIQNPNKCRNNRSKCFDFGWMNKNRYDRNTGSNFNSCPSYPDWCNNRMRGPKLGELFDGVSNSA